MNFAAVFRSRRRASKSGCDWTVRIIVSISAIMTLGLISCSVHSRRGSRGVGKLSESGLSRIADTSLDLGKGCESSILSNNRYGQRSGRQRPANRGAGNFLELEVEERHRFRNRSDIPGWSRQNAPLPMSSQRSADPDRRCSANGRVKRLHALRLPERVRRLR